MPDFSLETRLAPARVCGVDEAGRGPWAGPVVAASVLFRDAAEIPRGLNDSKKLSKLAREKLYATLMERTVCHGIGSASPEEIDALNIWGATQLAMRRAMAAMPECAEHALIDGKLIPRDFPCKAQAIIGGDGVSLSIAAASILAKVTRDRLMERYAEAFPEYGFDRHAGYGTAQHQEALRRVGPCPIHRRSFAPVRALLTEGVAA
jgi:ribonuclease HII